MLRPPGAEASRSLGGTGEYVESTLGGRLRAARKAKHLTLKVLAQQVDVSVSLLSKVENDKIYPSVTTLQRLSASLGVSIDHLIMRSARSEPPAHVSEWRPPASARPSVSDWVRRPGARAVAKMVGGVEIQTLSSPPLAEDVTVQLMTYPPGAYSSSDGGLVRHAGHECGYVIEGSLVFRLGFQTITLEVGDSVSFDSSIPHLYTNEGNVTARFMWVEVDDRPTNGLDGRILNGSGDAGNVSP
jgi:transcriptional regulator with XRE-family HTH domain/uncharacterized RmlC-like cupin family protein